MDRPILPSHVQSIICEANMILIPVMVSVVKLIIKPQKYLISFNLVNVALNKISTNHYSLASFEIESFIF